MSKINTNYTIEIYLKEIGKYSNLTFEEEIELCKIKENDKEAFQKLVNSNLRFVVSIAKNYQRIGLPLEDLISEGNFGLIKSIRKYDYRKGYHLTTYAFSYIKGNILRALEEQPRSIRLPSNQTDFLSEINKLTGDKDNSGKTYDDIKNIARTIDMKSEEVNYLLNISGKMISLDSLSRDDSPPLEKYSDDKSSKSTEEIAINSYLKEDINIALKSLSQQEIEIIEKRFGLNGNYSRSLDVLIDELNMPRERIRRIEQKGLRKLKGNSQLKEKLNSYLQR